MLLLYHDANIFGGEKVMGTEYTVVVKGFFIVIDGVDGSGKATQTKLLVERLRKEKKRVETIDFPRYYHNFFGKFIGQCLAGEHGDFVKLSPHIASVLYAADRFESKPQIESWLSEGKIVVADRYASANQIHQGGKIRDARKARAFLKWLEVMEFEVFKIPRPDLIVYLDVPVAFSMRMTREARAKGGKRYLGNRVDQHESSSVHLEDARLRALSIVKKGSAQWKKVECVRDGVLLTPEDIHDEVARFALKELKRSRGHGNRNV